MTPEHGSLVELGSVITSAELESDPVLEESPCDGCKMCSFVCPVGLIDSRMLLDVTVAGITETIAKKRPNTCCWIGCSGYEGMSASGDWSNWSPCRLGRPIPENHDELNRLWIELQKAVPQMRSGENSFTDFRGAVFDPEWFLYTMCGYCLGVCAPVRAERVKNKGLVVNTGRAALRLDGEHVVDNGDSYEVDTPFAVKAVISEQPIGRSTDLGVEPDSAADQTDRTDRTDRPARAGRSLLDREVIAWIGKTIGQDG